MAWLAACLAIMILGLSLLLLLLAAAWRRTRKALLEECRSLSDHVDSLACGNLTRTFPPSADGAPHPFAREIYETIREIKRSYNTLTDEPLERVCYIGTDPYLEGAQCARMMAEYCGGRGELLVIITVSLDISNLDLRYRGFKSVLEEGFPDLSIAAVFEAKGNPDAAYQYAVSEARERAALKGIYISGGSMAVPVAKALVDTRKAGAVALICHDLGKEMVRYLKDGAITAAILQDPVIQGHDSVIAMYNHLTAGWRPLQPRLLCVMDMVTKANCGCFWDFEKNQMSIGAEIKARMMKPAAPGAVNEGAAGGRLKIAVLGQEWNEFFLQTKSGALEAIQELRDHRVTVEWIAFNQARRSDAEIVAEIEALTDRFIREKYSGIVSVVGLKILVPHLNKAVAAGIPVITFNSEPLGLLGMLTWLGRTTKNLQQMSDELSEGSDQIKQAMEQISQTAYSMVDSMIQQGESTKHGLQSTDRLTGMLDAAAQGEASQLAVLEASSALSGQIQELSRRFRAQVEGMKAVKKDIDVTTDRIKETDRYSNQIGTIATKIDRIAEQTSILAINASIQAARVAESGKGFKVIADEIRTLSSDSSQAVVEVAGLIRNIQESVGTSVRATDQSAAEVQKQLELVEQGAADLDHLSRALVDITGKIQNTAKENAAVMLGMRDDSKALKSVMDATSEIALDNNSAIEELSASTVEISAQTKEIAKLVSLLKNIVLVLQGSLAQFHTQRQA